MNIIKIKLESSLSFLVSAFIEAKKVNFSFFFHGKMRTYFDVHRFLLLNVVGGDETTLIVIGFIDEFLITSFSINVTTDDWGEETNSYHIIIRHKLNKNRIKNKVFLLGFFFLLTYEYLLYR